MVDWISGVNLFGANARPGVTWLTPPKPYHSITAIPQPICNFYKIVPWFFFFLARPKTYLCCKRWPNPSESEMSSLSILKDFSLPCRFSHSSLHLAGISRQQQAEGRHIPPACWNMKSWISVGRNKSYSHFSTILEVNARNKMCFVMSLCLIRLLNFSWYWWSADVKVREEMKSPL